MISQWINKRLKWVFTLPMSVFVLVMMAFPIAYIFSLGFTEWSMSSVKGPQWVGLDNYGELFNDERFWHSVRNTLLFTGSSIVIETVLGVAIAILFFRKFIGRTVAKTLLILPMASTPVAMALVWVLIYEPTIGLANYLLKSLGLSPQLWISAKETVIPSLVLIDVWHWTPMVALIVMSGLASLPSDPYESALIDGASPWQQFTNITFPLLLPTIIVAVMLRLIDLLKEFDMIYVTTKGGPNNASETLNLYGFVLSFQYFKMGLASALLFIFVAVVVIAVLVGVMLRSRREGRQ